MQNDVLAVMLDMRNGQVCNDINGKFNEVLNAVLETGGKGELTIKLMVRPSKTGKAGAVIEVETRHECKLKKPELAVGASLFFVTPQGVLTRTDPDQMTIDEMAPAAQEKRTK